MAYRKLGIILSNQGRNPDEAKVAFTKAYEGRDRLPDRERLLTEAAYFTYVEEKVDSAVLAYEKVLDLYPTDDIASNNLAVLYGERGEPEKAAELYLESIERGDASAVSYTNALVTLFEAGQADSAEAILGSFREAHADHPQILQYGAAMASAEFDFDAAQAYAQELLDAQRDNPQWEMVAELDLARFAMARGRLNEAAERFIRAFDLQGRTPFTELPKPVFEALGLASIQLHFLTDPDGAVHTLDQVADLSASQGYSANLEFAGLYARAGRPDRARQFLAAYGVSGSQGREREGNEAAGLAFAKAAIALAEGDSPEAHRLYREGRNLNPKCQLCGLVELGEAFEAAAQPDSAVAVWEDYLGRDVLFRSESDGMGLHRVLLGLGRSYETLGRPELAVDYIERLLDLWSGADPGLGPQIEALRAKVLALQAG
jgi:tetratricopeptide (TPR) repeat protein